MPAARASSSIADPLQRQHIGDDRRTIGERSRLVERDGAYCAEVLQVGAAFDEDATPSGAADASGHGNRRVGHDQRTRSG